MKSFTFLLVHATVYTLLYKGNFSFVNTWYECYHTHLHVATATCTVNFYLIRILRWMDPLFWSRASGSPI